jgi:SAM-dependent methyltransferase
MASESMGRTLSNSRFVNQFAAAAERIREVGELLVGRAGVEPGMEVLDVGTGTGNAALPAAKAGARVIGLEASADLLAMARERAADAMIEVDWEEGLPEALPFGDASFDRVLSAFGHTFAPDPERAAAELMRVCRPGGAIGVCGWTENGVGAHVRRLTGVEPAWGDEGRVRELLGSAAGKVEVERCSVILDSGTDGWPEFVARSFDPFLPGRQDELREELSGLDRRQEYLLAIVKL